jgi:peptide-methionine (S)-S-oxide reductase
MPGVVRTRVGYAGGTRPDPTYRSLGDHTESIQIEYDPSKISYEELLRVFWTGHDATRGNWSRQYASLIFVHSDEQRQKAEGSKVRVEQERGRKVHTEILDYNGFTQAEDYHQKYSLRQFPAFEEELRRIYPSFADFLASNAVTRVNGYLGGEGSYEALQKEAHSFGLSSAREEELLQIVQRRTGNQNCPLPEKAVQGAR